MASQYFAILTDYGTRAIAHALSQGQPLQLTQFAVGDGNGQAVTPTASATDLVHQTHIAPVSAVSLDPRNNKQVIVELTIPENVGGFYIREMGVFDSQNKLIAYANCPESFKPTESSGSGKVQVLRMILKVESSSAVTLSIDNSVIFVTRQQMSPKTITAITQNGFDESGHTHEINKASTTQQGIVQLTNDTGLESESLALTAKAGKKLAQLIATVQLALNNYIPLNKRSSAVNSNDENNVATSKAVKTAYDKGIEAKNAADTAQRSANDGINRANNAQQSAEAANTNANSRVAKSGDTMTGNLSLKQGDYSGLNVYNNDGYYTRLEGNPNNSSSMLTVVYRTPQDDNITVASLPKKNGVIAYSDDVVSKNGDSMNGTLSIAKSTKNYKIGSYTWGMPIKFVGDMAIGNEKTIIAFNNNGSLHFGGLPNANQFNASLDAEKLYVNGDVKTSAGKSLNTALQPNDFIYQTLGYFEIRKYPDGTMIQSSRVLFEPNNKTTITKTLNWAQSFVGGNVRINATPIYLPQNELKVKAAEDGLIDVANANVAIVQQSNSKFTIIAYDGDEHSEQFYVDVTAIGRWR